MWIVKHNFLHDGTDSQLHQGPVEGGQLRSTGGPSQAHQVVNNHHHGPRDEHLVEDDGLHCMAKLNWIHLDDEAGVREHMYDLYTVTLQLLTDTFHLESYKPIYNRATEVNWGVYLSSLASFKAQNVIFMGFMFLILIFYWLYSIIFILCWYCTFTLIVCSSHFHVTVSIVVCFIQKKCVNTIKKQF